MNAIDISVIVTVVESCSSKERCLWLLILLVRGVVLLMAELWGGRDFGGQVLGLDVLDAVIATRADGHVRGLSPR